MLESEYSLLVHWFLSLLVTLPILCGLFQEHQLLLVLPSLSRSVVCFLFFLFYFCLIFFFVLLNSLDIYLCFHFFLSILLRGIARRQSRQFARFSFFFFFFFFFFFCWLSLGLVIGPRIGELFVSQSPREILCSHSQGKIPSNAYIPYSSSSCHAVITDIPDPISPLLLIVHRLW